MAHISYYISLIKKYMSFRRVISFKWTDSFTFYFFLTLYPSITICAGYASIFSIASCTTIRAFFTFLCFSIYKIGYQTFILLPKYSEYWSHTRLHFPSTKILVGSSHYSHVVPDEHFKQNSIHFSHFYKVKQIWHDKVHQFWYSNKFQFHNKK